jgi:hypothetical protein
MFYVESMPVMSLWPLSSADYREAMLSSYAQQIDKNRMTAVLACQEEILMLNFDNKPYIYQCLKINGNIGLFGIIYVSLSSKARQSNTQNHCISPLMLENIFHLSGNASAAANVLLEEAHPGFHSVPY